MGNRHDLVIRGGTIADGTGNPLFEGDIAIRNGRITEVGTVRGSGREEIDARDRVVTPGFIDVHTHYDGQATWEQRLSPSCNHGVTTVVAGNCGVGFAPCRPEDRDRLTRLMEGVEDIPEVVMTAGLPWNWETFPDFMEVLASRQLDVDIAVQIPHSPLRIYVMGERGANREPATADDLAMMTRLVAEAVRAGAVGVSTSRLLNHRSVDGTKIPSIESAPAELLALADGLRQAGTGVFQLIPDFHGEPETEIAVMRAIAARSGRPLSFTLSQAPYAPENWRRFLRGVEEANAAGVMLRGQVFPRPIGMMVGLDLSFNPLCLRPSWKKIAGRPLAEKVAALRDPEFRAQILAETDVPHNIPIVNGTLEALERMIVLTEPPVYMPSPELTLGARAAAAGEDLLAHALDAMLEKNGETVLYLASSNYSGGRLDAARALMDSEYTVLGLGDGGAHYGLICDASYPSTMLSYWARDVEPGQRIPLERAVKALSNDPAALIGMHDRGVLAPGKLADLNILDHDNLMLHAPRVQYDLPGGGRRLTQGATGYAATIKRGAVTYREGQPTGALPGSLMRRQDELAAA